MSVTLDPDRRTVRVHGREVHFTKLEFDVLLALVRADGRVISRGWLLDQKWDTGYEPKENSLKSCIRAIRKKLGSARHHLLTLRGVGYRWVNDRE